MRKIFIITGAVCLLLTACSKTPADTAKIPDYKVGIGSYTTTEESYGYSENKNGQGAVTTTYVAAVFDEGGKIVDVHIDEVETKINFDGKVQLADFAPGQVQSKRELGDSYGMKAASGIGKEWYQQADSLEDWLKGQDARSIIGAGQGKISSQMPRGDSIPYNANGTLGGNLPDRSNAASSGSVNSYGGAVSGSGIIEDAKSMIDGAADAVEDGAQSIASGIGSAAQDMTDGTVSGTDMWDGEDLKASVTIDTSSMRIALEKAYKNAK